MKGKQDLFLSRVGIIRQIIRATVSHAAQGFSNPIGNRGSTILRAERNDVRA
jgi:hypothetical protein